MEGKTFKCRKEACKYYNLDYEKVNDRLSNGWTKEEAFELVPRKNKYEITLEGKTFKCRKEACKYYKLNYNKVNDRLSNGWTKEEAFELVPRKRNK